MLAQPLLLLFMVAATFVAACGERRTHADDAAVSVGSSVAPDASPTPSAGEARTATSPAPGASPTPSMDAAPAIARDAGASGPPPAQPDAAPSSLADSAVSDAAAPVADGGALPPAVDYGAKGPFGDAKMFPDAGPDGTYFVFRPDTSLGRDGFKHPIGVWGNGLGTSPDQYQQLLGHVASHGFVIVACPDVTAEEPCLTKGIDWLVQQNTGSGPLASKLDTTREFSMGFSWGGGAAIDVSGRPNMKTTVSVHGMPPRNDPWAKARAPLALFSGTGDTIVPAAEFVTQNYNNSKVQTFFATIQDEKLGHMFALDPDSFSCTTGAPDLLGIGPCTGAKEEYAPIVAWLRYWILSEQAARSYFFGDDCKLCSGKWKVQRKNWM